MKHKIIFDITVNSYWPSERGEYSPKIMGISLEVPTGGTYDTKTIEFESDNDDIELMHDAEAELKKEMGDIPYHIWYWTWAD